MIESYFIIYFFDLTKMSKEYQDTDPDPELTGLLDPWKRRCKEDP
jgi:hypothetical protein